MGWFNHPLVFSHGRKSHHKIIIDQLKNELDPGWFHVETSSNWTQVTFPKHPFMIPYIYHRDQLYMIGKYIQNHPMDSRPEKTLEIWTFGTSRGFWEEQQNQHIFSNEKKPRLVGLYTGL